MPVETPEYHQYKILELWPALDHSVPADNFIPKSDHFYPLFLYLYHKTKTAYGQFPKRKDGQNAFLHPLNVVYFLNKAGVTDSITLCAALIHDLIEESVDCYKTKQQITITTESIPALDQYEEQLFSALVSELKQFAQQHRLNPVLIKKMLDVVKLLTRHKRDHYYRSIYCIYSCKNPKTQERAIQIKLADLMHNVQSLNTFEDREKIYVCFKALFILNNTKRYLMDRFGVKTAFKDKFPIVKLFKKSCKFTYDAFLQVSHGFDNDPAVMKVRSLLQLALRKFSYEHGGLWAVTSVQPNQKHPMRLFQGVVRKYDARLHLEFDKFNRMQQEELDYCRKFLADFKFTDQQLRNIIVYKDSYGLQQLVPRLLYKKEYVLCGFGCSELCSHGQICKRICR